jgi:hypothetical protein
VNVADISIERVAASGAENNLPTPSLDLDALQHSASAFSTPYPTYRQNTMRPSPLSYPTEDPWNIPRYSAITGGPSDLNPPRSFTTTNGATSTLSGSGLPKDWWTRQETVTVTIEGQQGHLLNRYTMYEISTDVSSWNRLLLRCQLMRSWVNSAVLLCIVAIPNLLSCGIAWFDDTRSDSSLHFRRSDYNVSLQYRHFAIPLTNFVISGSRRCIHRAEKVRSTGQKSLYILTVVTQERPCKVP